MIIFFYLLLSISLLFSCTSLSQKTNDDVFDDSFFEEEKSSITTGIIQKNKFEIGYAAWYGNELHGKPMVSGKIFDMNAYMGAHRSFAFGSQVMVTNLSNGKKRMVTIYDRGPYIEGRIIDVSYKTAFDLGFC